MSAITLQVGSLMPHFSVTTIEGQPFDYASIWQRRNLLLAVLTDETGPVDNRIVEAIDTLRPELAALDTAGVVTRTRLGGLPAPAVLIADRWGEIIDLASIDTVRSVPTASDLREWLEYLANRCPECEGEAK